MNAKGWAAVALLSVCAIGSAWSWHRRDSVVLLELFHDSECACGEFQQETSGITILHPLRDRSVERAADIFFSQLREGKCVATPEVCRYGLEGHRNAEWRLEYRRDRGDLTQLYYRLTNLEGEASKHHWSGEGLVVVERSGSTSSVVGYSSYY